MGPPGAPSLHCMTEPGCLCQLLLPQLSVKESIQETGGHYMGGVLFSEDELITILTFIHITHHLSLTQHHYKISHIHSAYHCSVHTHYPLTPTIPHTNHPSHPNHPSHAHYPSHPHHPSHAHYPIHSLNLSCQPLLLCNRA